MIKRCAAYRFMLFVKTKIQEILYIIKELYLLKSGNKTPDAKISKVDNICDVLSLL